VQKLERRVQELSAIQRARGYEQALAILIADFDGFLVRDGCAVRRRFTGGASNFVAYLLRCCRKMLEVTRPGAATVTTHDERDLPNPA